MRVALVALLLLAPGEAVRLEYRFVKGMVFREVQERVFEMKIRAEERDLEWKHTFSVDLERTVLEVDGTAHPEAERVRVSTFATRYLEDPEGRSGKRAFACEGKTFLWRRLKDRWALFEGEEEVTGRHKAFVDHLKNWRDARLPKRAVAPGDTWRVTAEDFLRTAGLPVPENVEGAALFRLERIEKGIALITFHILFRYREADDRLVVEERGRWRFDTRKGRDLESSLKGDIRVNEGRTGRGKVTIQRKVTYP